MNLRYFFRKDIVLRIAMLWYAIQLMLFPSGTVFLIDLAYQDNLWHDLFFKPEMRINKR